MRRILLILALLGISTLGKASDEVPLGKLGLPLGKYLTVEGEAAKPGLKVNPTCTLVVDTVNGKRLKEPVDIWIDNVTALPQGERCVIKGYESGRMIGVPPEVAEAENIPVPQAAWQFHRYFIMTSSVQPKNLAKSERTSYRERLQSRREAMKKATVEPVHAGDAKPPPDE